MPNFKQIVDQSEGSNSSKSKYQRNTQIEGNTSRDRSEFSQHGNQDVAKVVIGNSVSRQPWIVRREFFRVHDGIDKSEFHGFFSKLDFGIGSSNNGPPTKGHQGQNLYTQH